MAAHRCDDDQGRSLLDPGFDEMLEVAERPRERDFLVNRNRLAADLDRINAEFGLAARRRGMGEYLEACRHQGPMDE